MKVRTDSVMGVPKEDGHSGAEAEARPGFFGGQRRGLYGLDLFPNHQEVRDPVLVKRIANNLEAKITVERFEVCLPVDPDCRRADGLQRPLDELSTIAPTPSIRMGDDASEDHQGALPIPAGIGDEATSAETHQMAADGIFAVDLLIEALLLDDEHEATKLQKVVHLQGRESLEGLDDEGDAWVQKS